jgi:hypothetical protein
MNMRTADRRALAVGLTFLVLAAFGLTASAGAEVQIAAPEPCATALDVALTPATEAEDLADRTLGSGLPAVAAPPAPTASVAAALAGAAGSPVQQLSPTDVALGSPLGSSPGNPPAPAFPGVGACDDPGSGCMGQLQPTALPPSPAPQGPGSSTRVVVPPPVSPCGAPGFPCR